MYHVYPVVPTTGEERGGVFERGGAEGGRGFLTALSIA